MHVRAAYTMCYGDNSVVEYGEVIDPITSETDALIAVRAAAPTPLRSLCDKGVSVLQPFRVPAGHGLLHFRRCSFGASRLCIQRRR